MKKLQLNLLALFSLFAVSGYAQTTTFDVLNANYGSNKSVNWTSSNYGAGFGHRIINSDPGGHTLLNFQGRHNTANWYSIMTLTSDGRVGIKNTDPQASLDVSGNIIANRLFLNDPNRITNWNTLWQSGFYESYNATNAPEVNGWFWGLNMNHGSNNPDYKYGGQIAIKNSSSTPTMYFRSTNEDGIGTWSKILCDTGSQNINGNLTVDGKILCEEVEVVVDVNAPDYVFEKYYNGYSKLKADYVMPTLEEVEAYTKANNHLENVPSAKTLKEDGLQLKEMSIILLQKIEELTLYTIEQEKRIKTLEEQLVKK